MTTEPDRAPVDFCVLVWQEAHDRGDADEMAAARNRVLELVYETARARAVSSLWSEPLDRDDVGALGVEALVRVIDNYLANYDPEKGSLAGYLFKPGGVWHKEATRRVRGSAAESDSFNQTEMKILTLYYGYRETFRAANGYYPSVADAAENIKAEQVEYHFANLLAKYPELGEAELHERATRRAQQNGEFAALSRLEDLVVGSHAAKLVSADALNADSGLDGWSRIGDTIVEEAEEPLPQWVQLATFGMDGRVRRRATRLLNGAALEDEQIGDKDIVRQAHANLVSPIAQFVVLAGVANQIVLAPAGATGERELLLAAAAL